MKSMRQHMEEITSPEQTVFTEFPPLPEKLQLELNETCNHSCVFCPFHSPFMKASPQYNVMDYGFAIRVLEQAASLGIGRKELGLFASGEPLLYAKLEEVVKEAKRLRFPYVYITTNGTLASPDRVKRLIDAGIDSIRFSVNAGNRETYQLVHGKDDFDRVIDNIKRTNEIRKKIHRPLNLSLSFVRTAVTEKDYSVLESILKKEVDDMIQFDAIRLEEIDLEVAREYSVFSNQRTRETDENLICASIFNTMYIDSSMNVNLCCSSLKSKIAMTTLCENDDLQAAWNCSRFVSWRKRMISGGLTGTVCDDCYMRTIRLKDAS